MPPQSSSTESALPSQSSPPGGGIGIVSPAGSPPLILAFLAIGIFSAAMIAVFGWRRVQYSRGVNRNGGRLSTSIPPYPTSSYYSRFGQKPNLWDLRTDRNTTAGALDHGSWDSIMPLAVGPLFAGRDKERNPVRNQEQLLEVRPNQNPRVLPLGPRVSHSVVMYRMLASEASAEPSTLPPLPPPPSLLQRLNNLVPSQIRERIPHRNREDESVIVQREVEENPKDVRVAVIIEMPSPASSALRNRLRAGPGQQQERGRSMDMAPPRFDPRDARLGDDMNEAFPYSIGVYVCPWPTPVPPPKSRR